MYLRIIYSLVLFVVLATLTGCEEEAKKNFGAANEMLHPCLPEEYEYSAQPQRVWQVAAEIATIRNKGHFLVRDSDDLIISWVERLNTTRDKSATVAGSHDPAAMSKLSQSEVSDVGEGGMAVTTIYIRPAGEGSLMSIRRVYYGRLTQPIMVHSRGDFANFFQGLVAQEVAKQLILEGENNGSSL